MRRVLLLFLVSLAACDLFTSPDERQPLDEGALLTHLNYLAADEMYGRAPGSEEERRAARYIAERFSRYGLLPGVPGYNQEFEFSWPIPLPVDGQAERPRSQNVLAILPGEGDLASEWVVVGAHYDHIGFNRISADSVEVFNGADDNASGTAMMLEIARYLSDVIAGGGLHGSGRRSVMFHAYGAEEYGMLGSTYFCEHPTVSMSDIVAMINLDMVGRLRPNGLTLIGTSSSADWELIVESANSSSLIISYYDGEIGRSDQACFYARATPVMFVHTGMHNEYHTPFDDVELLNVEGMVEIGHFTAAVLVNLLTRADPPRYTGSVPNPTEVDADERFENRN